MAVVRLVSEKQAELRTFKAGQLKADALPPGPKKTAAQTRVNAFKAKMAKKADA